MYKLIKGIKGEVCAVTLQVGDILYTIPFAPDNTDYQAYLKWLAEGNTPLPAENA